MAKGKKASPSPAKQVTVRAGAKQAVRRSKASPGSDKIAATLRRLAWVSKQGAKNKLPAATSDHSYLYAADGTPR